MKRRILFFGSRTLDWKHDDHWDAIADQVKRLNRQYGKNGWVMVNGRAKGADDIAWRAAVLFGVEIENHWARWREFGNRAGYLRNIEMRDSGVDEAYGFVDKPLDESKGSAMMVDLLAEVGLEADITVLKPAK